MGKGGALVKNSVMYAQEEERGSGARIVEEEKRGKREYETSQAHTFSRIFHEEISSFPYFFKKKESIRPGPTFLRNQCQSEKKKSHFPTSGFFSFPLSSLSFSILSSPFPH